VFKFNLNNRFSICTLGILVNTKTLFLNSFTCTFSSLLVCTQIICRDILVVLSVNTRRIGGRNGVCFGDSRSNLNCFWVSG